MNLVKLYNDNNSLHKDAAKSILDKYGSLVNWSKVGNEVVLDIGCGSGYTTENILMPFLPKDFKLLVGVDMASEIIEFKKEDNKNPKLKYDLMNIESNNLDEKYFNKFDHIFSFYSLLYVKNQHQAYENIYKLLKPSGDILILTVIKNPVTQALLLHNNETELQEDFDNNPNIEEYIAAVDNMLTKIGFVVNVVEVQESETYYTEKKFYDLMRACEYIFEDHNICYPKSYDGVIEFGEKINLWKVTSDNEVILKLHNVIIKADKVVNF